jgi:transposase
MDAALVARRAELVTLTKHADDPRVRHRAHALLALAAGASLRATATRLAVSASSLRRWRARFLAAGGTGLADRPRPGRPPKLPEAARAVLQTALEADPMSYGYAVATWTIADLTDLLARRGWVVSAVTVNRTVHALGYEHRRPRHDLHHRQDAEAVASAAHALAVLQKKGLIGPAESAWSISTSASCIPIPTWRRSGGDGASRAASRPPAPTSG